MPEKVQLTAADLERLTLENKKASEALPAAPPKTKARAPEASPVVSPRLTPAWGVALPPALDLATDGGESDVAAATGASSSSSILEQEAAEAAAAAAASAEEDAPASAALLSMDATARQAAVDDALARLGASFLGTLDVVPSQLEGIRLADLRRRRSCRCAPRRSTDSSSTSYRSHRMRRACRPRSGPKGGRASWPSGSSS